MDLLNAVNRILPKLGEHTVTSLDSSSPTLAILLPTINEQLKELSIRGWWFNKHKVTLPLNGDSEIDFPESYLTFVADCYITSNRGGRLHNATDNTFTFTAPVAGTAISLVPFEELPESFAEWVFYSALVDAFITDIGVTPEARIWTSAVDAAASSVMLEHLRNMKYSTRRSPRYGRMRRAMCA